MPMFSDLKIRVIENDKKGLLAKVSLVVGDAIVLNEIKIVRTNRGLKVFFPEIVSKDRKYKVFYPLNLEIMQSLEKYVLYEYVNLREKGYLGLIKAIYAA